MDEERQRQLVDAFANNFLLGQGFTTITAARQQAEAILGVVLQKLLEDKQSSSLPHSYAAIPKI